MFQVPYELLNKKFRAAQKQIDREVAHVQSAALELERGLSVTNIQATDITKLLGGMVQKLQVLKRKVFGVKYHLRMIHKPIILNVL